MAIAVWIFLRNNSTENRKKGGGKIETDNGSYVQELLEEEKNRF